MSTTIPVNGHLLRTRIHQNGLQLRDVATSTGIGETALRNITRRNQLNPAVTVATIDRLLREAGMTAAEFYDTTPPSPALTTAEDDVAALAQVLHHDPRRHPKDRLCLALGWTRDRLGTALADLDAQVATIGLHVHSNSAGVTIRARDHRGDTAIADLRRIRDADHGLNNTELRDLYHIYSGTHRPTGHRTAWGIPLAALYNRGYLTYDDHSEIAHLAADLTYAFAVEPNPPIEQP